MGDNPYKFRHFFLVLLCLIIASAVTVFGTMMLSVIPLLGITFFILGVLVIIRTAHCAVFVISRVELDPKHQEEN